LIEKQPVGLLIRRGLEESSLESSSEPTIEALSLYVAELERWNRKINLTGKQTAVQIVAELLYDAFYAYGHVRNGRPVLDIGSGAGVVSIPFAILDRSLPVISVDASTKKIQFQRHIKRVLGLDNLTLYPTRIEDLEPQHAEIVIAKAFGPTGDVLSKASRHLKSGGRVLLMKGRLEPAIHFPGFELEETINYRLPGSTKEFKLITYKKVP
jgi:16S rRNA (guanine527-N7)-methyltransferase